MARTTSRARLRRRSGRKRLAPFVELAMPGGWARQQAQRESPRGLPGKHLRESRLYLVIPDDQVVARLGIESHPRVAKMGVYDARLVLLVVVHPQLHRRLMHNTNDHTFQIGVFKATRAATNNHDSVVGKEFTPEDL